MPPRIELHLPTRKDVVNKTNAIILTATVVSGTVGGITGYSLRDTTSDPIPNTPNSEVKKEKTTNELLQEILNTRPQTEKRFLAENEYLGRISINPTLYDIDRGFWVTTEPFIRASLLEMRWELRNKGHEKLAKLPEDKIAWALSQKIHPEGLAIATDAYSRALKIIATLNEHGKLRFDRKLDNPEEAMPNPGGMAMLIDTETGGASFLNIRYGFSHIGQGIALDEVNEEEFPGGKAAVFELSKIVSSKTNLDFIAENVAGSKRGNAASGGATGPIEFMPLNSIKHRNFILTETGEDLNPFDLTEATIMAYEFLARHEKIGEDIRFGYWRGHPADIEAAFAKWFGDYTHAKSIRLKAEDFYSVFIGSGKYTH